jgi:methionine-rich copper-binding protein CopC
MSACSLLTRPCSPNAVRKWLAAVVLGVIVLGPATALAHARLVRARPANKAELTASPERIELWFNELLDEGFNTVEVFKTREGKADKQTLTKGNAEVDPKDRTHLSIGVQKLEPGEYIVQWRVLSRDGHSAPGRFTFTIASPK